MKIVIDIGKRMKKIERIKTEAEGEVNKAKRKIAEIEAETQKVQTLVLPQI